MSSKCYPARDTKARMVTREAEPWTLIRFLVERTHRPLASHLPRSTWTYNFLRSYRRHLESSTSLQTGFRFPCRTQTTPRTPRDSTPPRKSAASLAADPGLSWIFAGIACPWSACASSKTGRARPVPARFLYAGHPHSAKTLPATIIYFLGFQFQALR